MSVSEPKVVLDQFGRSAFHRDALNWLIDVLPREVREANESVLQKSITHHRESLKSARRITKRWRRSILIVLAVRFLVGAAIFLVVMRGLYDLLPSWLFDLAGIFAVIGMLLYASRITERIPVWMIENRLVWVPEGDSGEVLDRSFVDEMKHRRALEYCRQELAQRARKS